MKLRYFLPILLLVAACDGSADLDNPFVGPISITDPAPVVEDADLTGSENMTTHREVSPEIFDVHREAECRTDDMCHRSFGLQYSCNAGRCGATSCETNKDCHSTYGDEYYCTVRSACEKIHCRTDNDCVAKAGAAYPSCKISAGREYGECDFTYTYFDINVPKSTVYLDAIPDLDKIKATLIDTGSDTVSADDDENDTGDTSDQGTSGVVTDEPATADAFVPDTNDVADPVAPEAKEEVAAWDPADAISGNKDHFLFARTKDNGLLQMRRKKNTIANSNWTTEDITPLNITNLSYDPAVLYNPTKGTQELFLVTGQTIQHFSGVAANWDNFDKPNVIDPEDAIESKPVALFHSNGNISLFVVTNQEVTQFMWEYDSELGVTTITSNPSVRQIGNALIVPGTSLAAVNAPDGQVFVFGTTVQANYQSHLTCYSSLDGTDWGLKPAGFGELDNVTGHAKRIGRANVQGSPVAIATEDKVYVYAKGDDDSTAEYHANLNALFGWSWDADTEWADDAHQITLSTHDYPYKESLSVAHNTATDTIEVFGNNNMASNGNLIQYNDGFEMTSTPVGSAAVKGRVNAVYNPLTQDTEIYALDKTTGDLVQYSYADGSIENLGDLSIAGNPVVMFNHWVK